MVIGEQTPQLGGLAGLARTGEHYHWATGGEPFQARADGPLDLHLQIVRLDQPICMI